PPRGRPARLASVLRSGDGSGSEALALAGAGARVGVPPGQRQTGRRLLRVERRIRVRRGHRNSPHGPAGGGHGRTGGGLASGRSAPGRNRFRPAHSDLERAREAQSRDPGGPYAVRGGTDVSPQRRAAGLTRLGWQYAAVAAVYRAPTNAL